MSRLGDLIRTEQIRQKLTPKQVAKKCGVSESYIMAVEAGTRIINDEQARRILRTIGLKQQTEADFSLDDIAATVDLTQVQPAMAQAVAKPKPALQRNPNGEDEKAEAERVAGSVWLDALQSVLKNVPVMNAIMQPIDHRLLPVINGRIEGAAPDKVFYFKVPDDSMRGFRIHSQDLALVVPAHSPIDGAVMLVEYNGHRNLRKLKRMDDFTVLLQHYDREYESEQVQLNELTCLGRAVRVEFEP